MTILIVSVLALGLVSLPGAKASNVTYLSDPNYAPIASAMLATNVAIQDGVDISQVNIKTDSAKGSNPILLQITVRGQVNVAQDMSAITISVQADKTTLLGQLAGLLDGVVSGYSKGIAFDALTLDPITIRALARLKKTGATFTVVHKDSPAWSDNNNSVYPANMISGSQQSLSPLMIPGDIDNLPAGASLAPITVTTNNDGSKVYSVKVLGLPLISDAQTVQSLAITIDKNQIVTSILETFTPTKVSDDTIYGMTTLTTINAYGKGVNVNIAHLPPESLSVDLNTLNAMVTTITDEDLALSNVNGLTAKIKSDALLAAFKSKTKKVSFASVLTIAKKDATLYANKAKGISVQITNMKTSIKIISKVHSSMVTRFIRISSKGIVTVSNK